MHGGEGTTGRPSRWGLAALLALTVCLNATEASAHPPPQVTGDEQESKADRGSPAKPTPRSGATTPRKDSPRATDFPDVIDFFHARFEEAKNLYAEANFKQSWQICESILVLAPDLPFREELRALRRRAQGRFIARSVVVVTFEADASQTDFPLDELTGHVVIENHSSEAIVLGRNEKDPVLGILHFRQRSLSPYSLGESAQEGTRVVRMPAEIEIEAGTDHRIPITVEFPQGGMDEPLMQRWMVSGGLRPITVKVGRDELTRSVPWVPNLGVAVPDEYREVTKAPLENMRHAILTCDPARLLIAATLWLDEIEEDGEERTAAVREKMVEELLGALASHDGQLDRVLIHALEELTGEVRERTTRSWQIWALTRPRGSTLPREQ